MRNNTRKESGITLVALGVTVLILMIISGITISMLTSDHGIIDEATNAQIQTEVSKLQETTDLYVKSRQIQKLKAYDRSSTTLESELTASNSITKVETTDGLKLGVFKDFKTVQFQTEFGEGGKQIGEKWTGKITDLQDCFAVEFNTNDIYYIVDGQIWKATGMVTAEQVKEESEEAGQNKPSETPTTRPSTSTEPSTEPTTSTDPTVEPTESTEPSEEPSTTPSTDPSPEFPTTPSPDPSWQDGPWEFEGFIDKNDEDDDDGITEEEIKDPEIDEPEPDTEYDGVFSKTITLNRYVYKNGGSQNNSIEGKVYKTTTKTQAAKLNLGEAEDVTINGGTTAKQREWSKQEEANTEEQTTKNTELELTTDDTYYMSYTYEVKATFYYNNNILTGGEEKTATAYMNHEGNKIGATPEKPTVTSEDEWKFRGWSENTESNTQDATESLKEITEDTKYYGSYQKVYTATLYEYSNCISTIDGYKYKDYRNDQTGDPTVPLNSSGTSSIPDDYVSKYGWATDSTSLTKAKEEGATVTLTNQTNNNYYMIYAGETITITLEKDGGEGEVENPTGEPLCNYDESTKQNASITIPDIELTKANNEFLGYADSSGATSAQYLKGQTYTSFTASKTIYAVWKQTGVNIGNGQYVEPNKIIKGYNGGGIEEWLPYYNDGTRQYIIANDYLPTSAKPSGLSMATSGSYYFYWKSPPSRTYSNVNEFWRKSKYTGTKYDNSKYVAELLDTSIWSKFCGTYGKAAIGSPSLEMFCDAYNSRYGDGKVGWTSSTYGLSYSGIPGMSDRAFVINENTKSGACWLASPHTDQYDYVASIAYYGNFDRSWPDFAACGLRPVVQLKSGVKIVEGSDGNYEIDGSGCTE